MGESLLIFLVDGMFIASWGIFLFLLWPWPLLSRSSYESVFLRNGFSPYFVQSTRGILVKRVRKLHRQVAHDLIVVHLLLTYFCKYCVVLKLPILWPRSICSKLVPIRRRPLSSVDNLPDHSWPLLTLFCIK